MTSKYIVVENSSYEGAVSKGLRILNLTKDKVDIDILEVKKGFLFKKGYFKLKITPKIVNEKDSSDKTENTIKTKKNTTEKPIYYQERIPIDSNLQINVCKNKMEATILITEPIGGRELSVTDILQKLNENNIVFGINRKEIEKAVENKIFNKNIVVACGTPPINGKDAKIFYAFDDDSHTSIPGTIIEEDGRIDYKNLNKIRNVKTGDLLVEIIPHTEGMPGTDVYGKEIVAKKGNPAIVKAGKNVKESEDGLRIYAAKNGEVYFENNIIYVEETITINGNIDNKTGNIKFNGKININGNVRSGFMVEAEGNIEVFGVVEGAKLISKGDIIIHRGVQGNNQAYLYCLGNLKSKYIENASINSAGNVEADVILHSNVIAKNMITVSGRKGLIVGGNIKAGKEVIANILGSSMGTSTIIEVGIDPKEKANYEQLKKEILDIEKNIENTKKAITLLNKMSKQQKLAKNKEDLLVKSLNTYEVLKKKHDSFTEELQILLDRFKSSNIGKIHSFKVIYSGVKIVIGNSVKEIHDKLYNSTLCIEDGEIVIRPYEK